jgi:hypothetical protein
MTIEENLGPERRMARHLDGQVAPVRVHDVKGIVTNEGAFGFQIHNHAALGPLNVPHRGWRPADQN